MKRELTADIQLKFVKAELLENGWCGMAWVCLRRNWRYQSACRRLAIGRLSEAQLCSAFGLRRFKSYHELFNEGEPPEFKVVGVLGVDDEDAVIDRSLNVRSKTLLMAPTQVAVVLQRGLSLQQQWLSIKSALSHLNSSSSIARAKGAKTPQKLGTHAEVADFLAPRLLAYRLARDRGWGPSRIGRFLFPDKHINSAKTKARDLADRGREYVEAGYLALAIRELSVRQAHKGNPEAAPQKPAASQPESEAVQVKPAPMTLHLITPLPPFFPRHTVRR